MTNTQHTGYHLRTQNGTAALITTAEALAEMNAVQMDKAAKRSTKSVSISGSSARIEYRDGRSVSIRPATEQEIETLTANGRADVAVDNDSKIITSLTPRMQTILAHSVRNTGGLYARNIMNGGGTSGALLRRGLIEYRENDGYYYTETGTRIARKLAAVSAGFEK